MLNFRVDNKIALVTGCSRGIGMKIEQIITDAEALVKENGKPDNGFKRYRLQTLFICTRFAQRVFEAQVSTA